MTIQGVRLLAPHTRPACNQGLLEILFSIKKEDVDLHSVFFVDFR